MREGDGSARCGEAGGSTAAPFTVTLLAVTCHVIPVTCHVITYHIIPANVAHGSSSINNRLQQQQEEEEKELAMKPYF